MRVLVFIIVVVFLACRSGENEFRYNTSIASKVSYAHMVYLDKTLYHYSTISDEGKLLFQESVKLDSVARELKRRIRKGQKITTDESGRVFDQFARSFSSCIIIDTVISNEIRDMSIESVSDVDYLRLYIKNNYVCILLNNKYLPFDTWSTMASAEKYTIKDGEYFEVSLSNTAWSSRWPNVWYLVKNESDALSKQNVVDTLYQNAWGLVNFRTKDYKKGENVLNFISQMTTPDGRSVSKSVYFYVE